jgi:hypothetical protein
MGNYARTQFAFITTIGMAIAAVIYQQVFVNELLPLVTGEHSGQFTDQVVWLDRIVPIVIGIILLVTWAWVIAGAVQEERTVDQRRRRL